MAQATASIWMRYQPALQRAVDFSPEIIFYQAGVDGLFTDKLGRLGLTHAGLRERDEMVLTACHENRIPCVITLGGGYSDPVEPTVEAHANTFRTAASNLFRIHQRIEEYLERLIALRAVLGPHAEQDHVARSEGMSTRADRFTRYFSPSSHPEARTFEAV